MALRLGLRSVRAIVHGEGVSLQIHENITDAQGVCQ